MPSVKHLSPVVQHSGSCPGRRLAVKTAPEGFAAKPPARAERL